MAKLYLYIVLLSIPYQGIGGHWGEWVCFCRRALCQSLLTVSFVLVAGFVPPRCPPMRTVLNIVAMGCHRLRSDSEGLTSRG